MDEERTAARTLELLGCHVRWENDHVSSIYAFTVGDNDLAQLNAFPALRELDLQRSRITNEGLAHLRDVLSLTRVHLGHTKVTAEGLRHLVGLNKLAALDLTGTKVVIDDAVEYIRLLSGLRWLDLRLTPMTRSSAAALTELKRALPDLRFHPAGGGALV